MASGSIDHRKSRATTAGTIKRLRTSLRGLIDTMSPEEGRQVLQDSMKAMVKSGKLTPIEKRLVTAVHQNVLAELDDAKKKGL